MIKSNLKEILIFTVILISSSCVFSQNPDNSKNPPHFGGAVTITNNGISFIPNFTLGKPAAIFDMNVGKGKLSFEPQFRFALEGKPWSILFWWRYKLLKTDRFQISLGAHPAISFRTMTLSADSIPKEYIVAQRYLAGELAPNYFISKSVNIGIYYFYGYCLEQDAVKNTQMFAIRPNFTNIGLYKQFYMRFYPQVYYLKMDKNDGFYFSASLTVAKRDFPFSVSSIINTPIETDIPSNFGFLWNVSLIYTFNKEYDERK